MNTAKVSDVDTGYHAMTTQSIAKTDQGHVTLQTVTRNGDMDELRRLVHDEQHLKKIDELDESGMSALHYAARANNFEAVALLLKTGNADPVVRDEEGATPLHYAARKKMSKYCDDTAEVVNLLVRYCDVNIRDKYGSTPLHFCAMRGNLAAARTLLQQPNVTVNAKDYVGCTPLHEACTYNHTTVADLLIKHDAKVTMKDQEGCTPLHLASTEGFYEMAKLLIKRCNPDFLQELIDQQDKDDTMALHYAVEARCLSIVKLLIKHGAKVNAKCRRRTSDSPPLHLAAVGGEPSITRYLLDHGAKIDGRDIRLATALHKAAQYDCVKDAHELMKRV